VVKDIELTLTVPEVNGVLAGLGQLPYAQVAALVEKIRAQAQPQVEEMPANPGMTD
jgi:hypothetical protein